MAEERKEGMGGLAKGLDVLLAFGEGRPELTLSEVAERTQLAPATARRCLLTLQDEGFVGHSERRFFLLPKVLKLSAAFLEALDIERMTLPHLTSLANATGDAASVTTLQGRDIVYLARSSARTMMRLDAHVGSRFPAFCTATGRILLAARTDAEIDAYLKGPLPALTEETVTDPAALKKILAAARMDGYAVVEDELAYGVISLAVPLHDENGRIVAALNSSGHSKRIDKERIVREQLAMVREHAGLISAEFRQVPQVSRMLRDE
ncbi:IclR family transcriptional regulator domain-containing protein [Sphingomonas sp.]|uniref:IclR family transcriptional regulator domain-containing protein n=1 Tax=Sphingomonas sp. TaxID=28214 RepID=UPI002DD647B0|nr:IclR family transcriptional regulator C-terminal domain-containing protein [Sphingomonas sp.]